MDGDRIIQFGTSRFLQAHADLFASEAAAAGQRVPPIIVVQTTRDPGRTRRIAAFGDPAGYPVRIQGIGPDRKPIDREVRVRSVTHGLSAWRDWDSLTAMFTTTGRYVVSNTGDTGYAVPDGDRDPALLATTSAPQSFPAILLVLLHQRWRTNAAPVTMLPCELVRRNGDTLKQVMLTLAGDVGADPGFLVWLAERCIWANTLVDRIVSAPIEPVGAVAEPYALWAIERQPRLALPFTHPSIVETTDLDRYERLKLHVLNLGHSWLAQRWIDAGRPAGSTVRAAIADPAVVAALRNLYTSEIVPGFAAHGLTDAARDYVDETLDRFANPFLDHQIGDIAQDHAAKLAKRVGGFVTWVADKDPTLPMPQLHALLGADTA